MSKNPSEDPELFIEVYNNYIEEKVVYTGSGKSTEIIDFGYHAIRYASFTHYFKLFCAFDKRDDHNQYITIMRK